MKNLMLEEILNKTDKNNEEWAKLGKGVQKAVRAYFDSKQCDYLVVEDLWEQDTDEFVDFLRECKIEKFIFAETSTEATKCLMKMIEKNCKVIGTQVYKEDDFIFSKITYKGLVIEL